MILAHHFILSAYGFWLPNDPRGSWSTYVGTFDLLRVGGPGTKVSTTRSVANTPHDRQKRLATKAKLQHPPVRLSGVQAQAVAAGFRTASTEGDYAIHACAILPEHAHLVVAQHPRPPGQISGHLKAAATKELRARGLWPAPPSESPWARKYWAVRITERSWVENAIRYVERNPEKEGKPRQVWSFVRPYEP